MKALNNLLKLILFTVLPFSICETNAQITTAEWTITPSGNDEGIYNPGQLLDISVDVNIVLGGSNWLHGISFDFPEGFDMSTLVIPENPITCGDPDAWGWHNIVISTATGETYGPGFFYDLDQDGDPGNNWGVNCPDLSIQLSFQIYTQSSCTPGEFPDGSSLAPTIIITGDGSSGSWTGTTPSFTDTYDDSEMIFSCCYTSENQDNVQVCSEDAICLMDFVAGEEPLEPGGIWTGPDNWISDDYCGPFIPLSNKEGSYTYSVEIAGCLQQSYIEIVFDDSNTTIPNFERCGDEIIDLYEAICIPNGLSLSGTWFFPNNPNSSLLEEVIDGLVDPQTDPNGDYIYLLAGEDLCLSKTVVNIYIEQLLTGGIETWIDLCPNQAGDPFCPFEMLDGNPDEGGVWISYNSDGSFQNFYSEYDICVTLSNSVYFTYVFSPESPLNFCNPTTYFTDLHVTFLEEETCVNAPIILDGVYTEANPSCQNQSMEIWVYNLGTDNEVFSTTTGFANGSFSSLLYVPASTYDVYIKIDGFLSKVFENINLEPGGIQFDMGSLVKGDLNQDDGINVTDLSIVNSAFGSESDDDNFNPVADLNCDSGINILDLSTLNPGFNLTGEHVLLLEE